MYEALRPSKSEFPEIRGLRYHVRIWDPVGSVRADEPATTAAPAPDDASLSGAPTWFLLHGWMDISASFQFLVDQLPRHWRLIAPDWRGYGRTQWPAADCYWFPDYLADLDGLIAHFSPHQPVRLIGHSMGGNVACLYAGVRAKRVASLVNLEGLGLRPSRPEQAPARYAQWLDEIRDKPSFKPYESRRAVAERLMKNNQRLPEEFAEFLADHWSAPGTDGQYRVHGDPAHRIVNPYLYQADEIDACWQAIEAPVLWVVSEHLGERQAYFDSPEYRARLAGIRRLELARIEQAGHMMHHDQPRQLAEAIVGFAARAERR